MLFLQIENKLMQFEVELKLPNVEREKAVITEVKVFNFSQGIST